MEGVGMNLQAVLKKTGKGVEEIETRKHKLEQKLRTLLIVVNGKATGADLVRQFEQIGDIRPMLEQLLAGGFIESVAPAADFKAMRIELAQALTDALGPAGDPIVMRFEACKSPDDARAFVESQRSMLEKLTGPRGAAFLAKAKRLLG
jgi:hypothetical protein